MVAFKPWEWLALQRRYFAKPREGLASLQNFLLPFSDQEKSQGLLDFEQCQKNSYRLICWGNSHYPTLLNQIYDPPILLLANGKTETLSAHRFVAVVGARKASDWGMAKTKEIVKDWVASGFGIVSGLAYGIDAQAHRSALEFGAPTWGVLGSSLDCLYPLRHSALAKKMEQQGGILSEFPLGSRPERFYFPQRNRIISGLAQAVVVVEATETSGSLITARFALEQGREVYVVPPPSEAIRYAGNIKLLEEGATPLGGTYTPRPLEPSEVSKHWLLTLLQTPQTLEALLHRTHKTSSEVLSALTQLESIGRVKRKPGPKWQSP